MFIPGCYCARKGSILNIYAGGKLDLAQYAYNRKSKLESKQVVIPPVIQFKNANRYFYNILT